MNNLFKKGGVFGGILVMVVFVLLGMGLIIPTIFNLLNLEVGGLIAYPFVLLFLAIIGGWLGNMYLPF